ncbi:MAG: sigma-54-dependent Fis family transcriptional regulator [Hahellaceae bacterium]|nr:sigma-54-dependent Fis family transcriptional regulator [Hahellaceae bacterium]
MAHILLLDDDTGFTQATQDILELLGHTAQCAATLEEARQLIVGTRFDLAILDLMLPDGSGLQIMESLNSLKHAGHIAIVTGNPNVKSMVRSLCGPDLSYLLKPLDLDQIKALLSKIERTNSDYVAEISHFGCLIGESPAMKALYEMIERVASSRANVMLMGESGVGKELVARALHNASHYQGPFVAANCGAISRELIGSELFGHEKGAFTGAIARKVGLFERAEKGTLFLDEITEMPIDLQPSLLRVLETNQVVRVGGTAELPVSCRIVSATNRTTEEIAERNCLREDIYFRLAVFPIMIPPLRQRKEDIPLLVEFFLQGLNLENGTAHTIDKEALQRLQDYDWPGNVRELRHAVHRAFILTPPGQKHLSWPDNFGSPFAKSNSQTSKGLQVGKTISEIERELITMTLAHFGGDKKQTADVLGISLKTLYNRLNEYEGTNDIT